MGSFRPRDVFPNGQSDNSRRIFAAATIRNVGDTRGWPCGPGRGQVPRAALQVLGSPHRGCVFGATQGIRGGRRTRFRRARTAREWNANTRTSVGRIRGGPSDRSGAAHPDQVGNFGGIGIAGWNLRGGPADSNAAGPSASQGCRMERRNSKGWIAEGRWLSLKRARTHLADKTDPAPPTLLASRHGWRRCIHAGIGGGEMVALEMPLTGIATAQGYGGCDPFSN